MNEQKTNEEKLISTVEKLVQVLKNTKNNWTWIADKNVPKKYREAAYNGITSAIGIGNDALSQVSRAPKLDLQPSLVIVQGETYSSLDSAKKDIYNNWGDKKLADEVLATREEFYTLDQLQELSQSSPDEIELQMALCEHKFVLMQANVCKYCGKLLGKPSEVHKPEIDLKSFDNQIEKLKGKHGYDVDDLESYQFGLETVKKLVHEMFNQSMKSDGNDVAEEGLDKISKLEAEPELTIPKRVAEIFDKEEASVSDLFNINFTDRIRKELEPEQPGPLLKAYPSYRLWRNMDNVIAYLNPKTRKYVKVVDK